MDTEDVPLLEREAQLASLGEYAAEARTGDGRMVLVAGEAGVGKSALVEQLQRELPSVSWFWGACHGLFTPRPLGPLFDIAAKLGGELLELCRADAPRPDLFSALLRHRLDEAMRSADGTTEPQHILRVRLARAEAHWLAGQTAEARRDAELAEDVSGGADDWERGMIAAWLRRTGSARPPRGALAEPYRQLAAGDWEQAARAWTELGCRYEAALALLGSGQEAALRDALRIFTDLGVAAAAGVTRQAMRERGVRSIPAGPRAATRAHPMGLTRREHEVLDLICAGHTNAEIAGQLFISAKTVDHHVSAVLAKLGVPDRNAAARQAARLGLTSTVGG